MTAEIIPVNRRQDQAWADYLSAKMQAEASGRMDDGIEAGKAWRRWLDLFMTSEQRQKLDAPIRMVRP